MWIVSENRLHFNNILNRTLGNQLSSNFSQVFDKACKYKKHNSSDKVLPVVLLDEIGLAEISTYNPLKVLHRLLEPELSEFPEVAVVGISNWALDAAKMNRAIHLSRPEPTLDDLHETGLSVRHAQTKEDNFLETRSGKYTRVSVLLFFVFSYYFWVIVP